jgi:hypothetical protein
MSGKVLSTVIVCFGFVDFGRIVCHHRLHKR